MKVQLITAKHTEAGRTTNPPRPPIGLEMLAASLEQRCTQERREVDIEILDGEITAPDVLASRIGGEWVGFSDVFSNHRECLALAKIAKQRGAKVVFGGPNATHLAERILNNHSSVDFIVAGDGEKAFADLLLGVSPEDIPNLCFRGGGGAHQNRIENVDVNTVPLFTLDHIQGREAYLLGSEPVPVCSIRGCAKAIKEGRCAYCSIPNQGLRLLDPDKAWQQVCLLRDRYGATSFFETGDSYLVEEAEGGFYQYYPQRLMERKPPGIDVTFRIYERPEMITEQTGALLKKLGVKEVFLGFEHVDETIRSMSKRMAIQNGIWTALDILSRLDMHIILAVIFGLPGETVDTAERNHDFVLQAAARYPSIRSFFVSVAMPLYGSRLFRTLASDPAILSEYNKRGHDLDHDDSFDYDVLMHFSIERRTSVQPQLLRALISSLRKELGLHRMTGFGESSLLP